MNFYERIQQATWGTDNYRLAFQKAIFYTKDNALPLLYSYENQGKNKRQVYLDNKDYYTDQFKGYILNSLYDEHLADHSIQDITQRAIPILDYYFTNLEECEKLENKTRQTIYDLNYWSRDGLIEYCREKGIKQSRYGKTNKRALKANIVEKILSRDLLFYEVENL